MGTLEQTKVVQAINRLESVRFLLNEISKKEEKYKDRFSLMTRGIKAIWRRAARNFRKNEGGESGEK